ncbi:MAG: hypothetical protein ABF240_07430 [Flavobacteriales bacterium]
MKKLITLVMIIPFMGFTQESILEKRLELKNTKTQNTTSTIDKVTTKNKAKLESCFLRSKKKIGSENGMIINKITSLENSKPAKHQTSFEVQANQDEANKASCFLTTVIDLETQKTDKILLCLSNYKTNFSANSNTNSNQKSLLIKTQGLEYQNCQFESAEKVPVLHNGVRDQLNKKGIINF